MPIVQDDDKFLQNKKVLENAGLKGITEEQKALDLLKILMNDDNFLTLVGIPPRPIEAN